MSITVAKNGASLVIRNGFNSVNHLVHASRQWTCRINVDNTLRKYIKERNSDQQYIGIATAKNYVSVSKLDSIGMIFYNAFIF